MSNTIKTINPATEEELKSYELMTDEKAEKAVQDCHKAFLSWRLKSPEERAEKLKAVGKKLDDRKEDLAKLMTQVMGKLIKQGHQEVGL